MFYNQPLSIRFGTELLKHVEHTTGIDPYWDSLDIAVAWVRASGMRHLSERLEAFLHYGGALTFTVGIDLQSTTKEGLQALLDLEQHGKCETYIYHNEAGSIFHPKLYLFRNEDEARLIVGSNNITESGLYSNVEAGLQIDTELDAGVIKQAIDALASWKDTTNRFAIRLDAAFLESLNKGGYVPDEASTIATIKRDREGWTKRSGGPLFASRRYSAPMRTKKVAATVSQGSKEPETVVQTPTTAAEATPLGTVLLMRLRKASVTDRPTQTQIPFRVRDMFFKDATVVRSAHSGVRHGIISASARGAQNTTKLEIPEMRDFVEPVARFEYDQQGIVYEVYDVGSPKGNQIMGSLSEGQEDGTTQQSISDADRATWWRFI